MRRTLVLKKETLSELTRDELTAVAGGALTPKCPTREYGCRVPTDHCQSLTDCTSVVGEISLYVTTCC